MAQATETVPVRRIPKQPECNIGTSGHVDHGKCLAWNQEVLVDGVPVTGKELFDRARSSGLLIAKVDGGELYSFSNHEVISVNENFEPIKSPSFLYVEHYTGPLYSIKGRTGRKILVTPEHPLLINRKGTVQWIRAREIHEGDCAAFLGNVPLSESVTLRDALPSLKEKYTVVTSEEFTHLSEQTADFTDYGSLSTKDIDKVRILAGLSTRELSRRARTAGTRYSRKVREGIPLSPSVRRRIIRALQEAGIKRLSPGEFALERLNGHTRPINVLREIISVDEDVVKWFAFVWSEGTSSDRAILVTQTLQQRMLQEYLRISKEKFGLSPRALPEGCYGIHSTPFVDYISARFDFKPGNESTCGIADWVCKLPRNQKALFLRWFFTLEGEFNHDAGQVSITQLNPRNTTIISYLLHSFGIVPRFNTERSKTKKGIKEHSRLTISGRKDLQLYANAIGFEDATVREKLVAYLTRIERADEETDRSIPIDKDLLRSLLKRSGLTREGFDRAAFSSVTEGASWYHAYSDAMESGRLSRPKLRVIIAAMDEQLAAIERSAGLLELDGPSLRYHTALIGVSLDDLAGEMGYSRKKLVRVFARGSREELSRIRSFLTRESRGILDSSQANVEQLRRIASSPLEFDEIIQVSTEDYDGFVFDLSVPGHANFIAGKGATICHNTSLVAAITGVWASAHSEELKRGITIKVGYADAAFYKCPHTPPPEAYSTSPVCPVCGQETQLLRAVSFVDSPGHESLMTNMLAGAAVMDGAILVIAANEPVPMPQTREHMLALQMLGMKKMVIVQNKVDRVDTEGARKNYEAIKKFLSGTIAADAPVIPVSAQHRINIDALIEAIEQYIPTPQRDISADAQMVVLRSFDVNKPGTEISSLVGGVLGGSVVRGELNVGDEIEIAPGLADDRGKYSPLLTKVASLGTGVGMAEKVGPGGLVSLGTYLDPSLTKGDLMVGSLVGKPGSLPPAKTHIAADLQLFEQAVGSAELLKVDKVRVGEQLRLNIGTAATLGTVTSARDTIGEMDLRKPVVAEKGSRVALSRRIAERWRLIGSGVVR